jgi:hypothetical protein
MIVEPQQPYSHLRGFNYTPSTAFNDIAFWRDYDEALVERELTYAQRLGLNSARIFLAYVVYEHEPQAFLRRLKHFVQAAGNRGLTVMPVIWDSCFTDAQPTYDARGNEWLPNPGVRRLGPDFWPEGERYCRALVETLGPEPGLLMWDVMNEPLATTWVTLAGAEAPARTQTVWRFVRHFCKIMKEIDTVHPVTVGVAQVHELPEIATEVDVLSFHDYSGTRAVVSAHLDEGIRLARDVEKPLLISEVGCLAWANPYDMTLELCQKAGVGWYVWELMIGASCWREIHGLVYPDGTVRDPSIVAALLGFFRKRSGDVVPPDLNKHGHVTRVLDQAKAWLADPSANYRAGLAILEQMANLLEAGEAVPMHDLPSARVLALSEESAAHRAELNRLLALWGDIFPHQEGMH